MKCEQVQEKLSEYLEGHLDEVNYRAVKGHLSSCHHCQAVAQTLTQSIRAVADLPAIDPPFGFLQKVMAKIREEAEKPSLWHRFFLPIKNKIPKMVRITFLLPNQPFLG